MNGIGELATWGIIIFLWLLLAAYLAVNVYIFLKRRIWEYLTITTFGPNVVGPLVFSAFVAIILIGVTRYPYLLSSYAVLLAVLFAPLVVDVIRISKWWSLK